ncbi:MAG: 50S ribosomal protein L9 [Eggerthellaceae bacterium]
MKVILLTEVKGKGGEGDVVEVAAGFANNYLLPQGMAVAATKGNLKQLEQRKHNIAAREENRIADANKTKATLDALTAKVEARVGEEGVLFGSVTAQMVADAVKAQADIDIDRRRIEIKSAIKSAGAHEVTVALYRDIKANLTILVGDESTFAAEEAVEEKETTEAVEAEEATEEEAAE